MKYFIQYPIMIVCGLKCSYCLHKEAWDLERDGKFEEKFTCECPFTFAQYQAWRDKHLSDATEIIMELHGGEMSYGDNQRLTLDIIDAADKEKFSLQTNGLGEGQFYEGLVKRKGKIERVGFTYHRAMITGNQYLWNKFVDNVHTIREARIGVYVKELLISELRDSIIQGKTFWENLGVEFRLQDYKGIGGHNAPQYTPEYVALIHPEYQHVLGAECACRKGYKNIIIRGYDINAAVFGGDVLACWHDPTVIGNINNDWYSSNYRINRLLDNSIDVAVPQKLYRGNLPKDRFAPENVEKCEKLNKYQLSHLKQRSNGMMQDKLVDSLNHWVGEREKLVSAINNALIQQAAIDGRIAQIREILMVEEAQQANAEPLPTATGSVIIEPPSVSVNKTAAK